jgi:hypothetical protein
MANENHLLVVRPASAHPFIEQNFAARLGYVNGEASIFFRTKREVITMRTPEQTSNIDATSTCVGQERSD